jgi:hypothetical protein
MIDKVKKIFATFEIDIKLFFLNNKCDIKSNRIVDKEDE